MSDCGCGDSSSGFDDFGEGSINNRFSQNFNNVQYHGCLPLAITIILAIFGLSMAGK